MAVKNNTHWNGFVDVDHSTPATTVLLNLSTLPSTSHAFRVDYLWINMYVAGTAADTTTIESSGNHIIYKDDQTSIIRGSALEPYRMPWPSMTQSNYGDYGIVLPANESIQVVSTGSAGPTMLIYMFGVIVIPD